MGALRTDQQQGYTLLEALLAIFVMSIAIIVFTFLAQIINVSTESKLKAAAYNLAIEELERVRNARFVNIENRDDASPQSFMNIVYDYGTWQVATSASAHSAPNVYEAVSQGAGIVGSSGTMVLPSPTDFENRFTTFTFDTEVYVASDSPSATWEAGFAFRARDENMQYRAMLGDDKLTLTRVLTDAAGAVTSTVLYTSNPTINPNTWYRLRVRMTDDATNNIRLYLGATEVVALTDASIDRGNIILMTRNGAHALFDDVRIATNISNIPPAEPTWDGTWTFDSGETIGAVAVGWSRFGINDLPDATPNTPNDNAELLITEYNGNADLKNVSATVSYRVRSGTKSIMLETLMSRYGTAQ